MGRVYILLAEDDFTSRRVLQSLLQDYGEVHIAANGAEALDAVHYGLDHDTPYGLICLDYRMPGLDGHQVLEGIRRLEDEHDIPIRKRSRVLMITGEQSSKTVMEAFRKQVDGYLLKPISKRKLKDALCDFGMEG